MYENYYKILSYMFKLWDIIKFIVICLGRELFSLHKLHPVYSLTIKTNVFKT